MKHYTKRAEDSLDLNVLVDFYIARIASVCKSAVAFSATKQVTRLTKAKMQLEAKLSDCENKSGGLIYWLKNRKIIAHIKQELAELKTKIVVWVNSVYRYFSIREVNNHDHIK